MYICICITVQQNLKKNGYMYMYNCTNTTLQINYTPMKIKNKKTNTLNFRGVN